MTKPVDPGDLGGKLSRSIIMETPGPPAIATLAGPPSPDLPGSVYVLEPSALAAIRDVQAPGEADLLTEMVEAFLGDAPAQLAQMADALLRSDGKGLAAAAHMLKSGAAYLGAMELERLCLELENLGRSGPIDGAQLSAEPLWIAFEQTRRALFEELHRQDATS